ncbi:MAG: cation:proton antiporter, partial [Deltaproteobacteria bacterium]|nr:cation:proton antiporter [Deltaproteobacteria bacterium]
LFSICLGMHTSGAGANWGQLAHIPVSVVLGIVSGVIPGLILYRLFTKYDWRPPKRTLVVLGVAILLTWMEKRVAHLVPVAGLLGVMTIGAIILEKSEPIAHLISRKLKHLWVFAELILFVLVGAQVNISVAWQAGLAGMVVILAGLVCRSLGTWLSLTGAGLTAAEKLFCIVAYVPKATVQAAIGAVPLAAGVAGGEVILAVAVLSILVSAPLGAVGISRMGEKILDHGRRSSYRFKELRANLALPRVGERVRNKRSGIVWKVIQEKESWLTDPNLLPSIELRLWLEDPDRAPGTGKTIKCRYSQTSTPFAEHWEVLYDW